ncbi:hypothetical protein FisN_1Lh605 [Fistulifera solaris]|uniref:Uncharacterized protein n=1 Tax=Fistulifera solaris TaxID=1519565 RepID=A0A1Z5K1D4_FISSO|nr:hypothetical protein FisN_1Lh605 [Fistulifera solaris]|eukprot:GAX19926.1 hypothetical protein FisN_1Lh605 [Fistulifera solaris]
MNERENNTVEASALSVSKNNAPQTEIGNTPSSFGNSLAKFSDSLNENLILARYTTMATITALAVYGLAHTPLFFRYRTVSEIPAHYFTKRRTIHCRLVKRAVSPNNNAILCQVRHLSPMERVLSKSWFDWVMRMHPAAAVLGARRDELDRELLTVQLAAVVHNEYATGQWWDQLIRQRTPVSCQLMARQVRNVSSRDDNTHRTKRKLDLPELELLENSSSHNQQQYHEDDPQVAIVKMYYRSNTLQLFPVDVGESMVRQGHASPCTDGLYPIPLDGKIRDASDIIRDLRIDSAYTDRIAKAEFEAAKKSYGMWSDPRVREARRDIVEEVEFQMKAPWYKKVFRWVRGG